MTAFTPRPSCSPEPVGDQRAEDIRRKVGRSKNARRTVTLAGSVPDSRFADERVRRYGRLSA